MCSSSILKCGLENPRIRAELRKESFYKTSFQLVMGVKKVQKQGRNERIKEDYPICVFFAGVS